MKGEYISIETLKMYQEIEKENKELHKRIDKAIEYIKENRVDLSWFMATEDLKLEGIANVVSTLKLLEILGDKDE